jgi:hypothetical protein
MNNLIKVSILFCLSGLIGCTIGNGHICGPQTPQAYCDREAYERLLHPKGIGEYWEKPDKTVEGWRSDWVSCGGKPNGDYLPYKPEAPGDKAFHDAYKKKENHLWNCMTQKGYQFNSKYWPE